MIGSASLATASGLEVWDNKTSRLMAHQQQAAAAAPEGRCLALQEHQQPGVA
jgi:hypothetical protein